MGEFCKAVQNDEVIGPLRRGFKPSTWDAEYKRLGNDEADAHLHTAGILVFTKANAIRSRLQVTFSKLINATTKLRLLTASANHNFLVVQEKFREACKKELADIDQLMTSDFTSLKLELPVGVEFSPDEIVQSLVDGTQVPIKAILEQKPDLSGNPQYRIINWDHILEDFNLGTMYALLEGLWDDCLWNEYLILPTAKISTVAPENPVWQHRLIASQARHDNLALQFYSNAQKFLMNFGEAQLHARIGVRDVKAIKRDGRKQVFQLAEPSRPTPDGIRMLAARFYAVEFYYSEILQEPLQMLRGATLNQLLGSWTIVSRTAEILLNDLRSLSVPEDAAPEVWLPKFAPVIQRDALVRAVAEAVKLEYLQAKIIVEFFIYRGQSGQEIWAQPLIPVGIDTLVPFFPALSSPNLRRLIDIWLRQLDMDLGVRGPLFEDFVRQELSHAIQSSSLLSNSISLSKGLKFRPHTDREEQIDVVLIIDDLVILGEAKCVLHPAEAKQIAMHRKTVVDAAFQVKRKADSVQKYREDFRAQLISEGVNLPEDFKVLPMVILNGAIHAGFEVEGVPVVDLYILNVFFQGELIDLALRHPNGHMEHVKKRIFYNSVTEAVDIAPKYFREPPQMECFTAGLTPRWIPILSLTEGDWDGRYITYGCNPKVERPDEIHRVSSTITT